LLRNLGGKGRDTSYPNLRVGASGVVQGFSYDQPIGWDVSRMLASIPSSQAAALGERREASKEAEE